MPPPPPSWPYSGSGRSFDPRSMNGFELLTLGEIKAEGHRHTEILLGIQSSLIELPDKLAEKLSPGEGRLIAGVRAMTELFKALLPLVLLSAAVLAKWTWPEATPVIRRMVLGVLGLS